jgi:uncharacterized membrane protein YgcG
MHFDLPLSCMEGIMRIHSAEPTNVTQTEKRSHNQGKAFPKKTLLCMGLLATVSSAASISGTRGRNSITNTHDSPINHATTLHKHQNVTQLQLENKGSSQKRLPSILDKIPGPKTTTTDVWSEIHAPPKLMQHEKRRGGGHGSSGGGHDGSHSGDGSHGGPRTGGNGYGTPPQNSSSTEIQPHIIHAAAASGLTMRLTALIH